MKNPSSTATKGSWGEEIARKHLLNIGMQIIETNYRYGHEEIDIVARDGDVLVFCEVKARTTDKYGEPEYAITPSKQKRIRRVALAYLVEKEIKNQDCRFDVVAIKGSGPKAEIRYISNAF